jgi:poly(A) polymerase
MAVALTPEGDVGDVLDPLQGGRDLREKTLRACSSQAIADDPVRALRAVRFAVDLGLRIDPDTLAQVRSAPAILDRVSPERVRDELFRILDGPRPGQGLRLMDELGLLECLVPELGRLRGLVQPEPHSFDGLSHALATVDRLGDLVGLLCDSPEGAAARDLAEAETLIALGRFRRSLCEYLAFSPSFGRRRRALLAWAALLHDLGKPETQAIIDGRLRFHGHELVGSRMAVGASRRLRLSTVEQAEVEMTVLHHMRPAWMEADGGPTARGTFRFYQAAESTGVSVVLLSLADLQARDAPPVPAEAWRTRLATAQTLLDAWFAPRQPSVSPVPLLSGDEVMQINEIPPGPEVGRILDALREAQAIGEVRSRDEALAFVERLGRADG